MLSFGDYCLIPLLMMNLFDLLVICDEEFVVMSLASCGLLFTVTITASLP
jgi:hypothetical protein